MNYKVLFISIGVLISGTGFSQILEKNCEYHLKDGSVLKGDVVSEKYAGTKLVIMTNDTLYLPNNVVKNRYKIKDHFSYERKKFHHKTGSYLDLRISLGGGNNSAVSAIEIAYYRRFSEKLHAGIGIGSLNNFNFLTIQSGALPTEITLSNQSVPLFGSAKCYLNSNRRRIYAHAKLGYTIGVNNEFTQNTNDNGFMANYGLGFTCASRYGLKAFFELNQMNTYGSGNSTSWDISGPVSTEYDIWFNNITIAMGLEINLTRRRKKF